MTSETEMVIAIWDNIRSVIPARSRDEVAEAILRAVKEYGFEATDISAVVEEDTYLRDAYEVVYDDGDDEDEALNDEDDD